MPDFTSLPLNERNTKRDVLLDIISIPTNYPCRFFGSIALISALHSALTRTSEQMNLAGSVFYGTALPLFVGVPLGIVGLLGTAALMNRKKDPYGTPRTATTLQGTLAVAALIAPAILLSSPVVDHTANVMEAGSHAVAQSVRLVQNKLS